MYIIRARSSDYEGRIYIITRERSLAARNYDQTRRAIFRSVGVIVIRRQFARGRGASFDVTDSPI